MDSLFENPLTLPLLIALTIFIAIAAIYFGWHWLVQWRQFRDSFDRVMLSVAMPKKESEKDTQREVEKDWKETIGVMEHLIASLHSIYSRSWSRRLFGQQAITLELATVDRQVYFYISTPPDIVYQVEKQITSYYPDAVVEATVRPQIFDEQSTTVGAYLQLRRDYIYPIKVTEELESDPLNNITNVFSKLTAGEAAAIQIAIRPVGGKWAQRARAQASQIYSGKEKQGFWKLVSRSFSTSSEDKLPDQKRLTPMEEEKVKKVDQKASKVGFDCSIRLLATSTTPAQAQMHLTNIIGSFSQFFAPNINGFKPCKLKWWALKRMINQYILRIFGRGQGIILSSEELASIYHFPHIRYNKSPVIHWQMYRSSPPPGNLDTEGTLIGHNTYRGVKTPIYLPHADRFRHFYVIGQTGTGKTTMLIAMARQDIERGAGVCVMDPHGELADDLISYIPKSRAEDVIFFNPEDLDRPLGLNLLEAHSDDQRDFIVNEALNIMLKLYGEEIFSPRLQDYFRNGCWALMSHPEGGALTDIVKIFTDEAFQKERVKHINNPVIKDWWVNTYASMGQREKDEMIPYFAAKFGAFISNTMLRNIIGQTKSAFDFGQAMQEGKIILVNLSKGTMGEFNSKLLGMIIVTKIQAAAMARARIAKEERRDFFFYIDEFQNFVTDSIESILSEARKYRLSLTIAHQFIKQLEMDQGAEKVKGAVFGNIGSMMSYRVSPEDAEFMALQFSPTFSDQDIVNFDQFKGCAKLSVAGQTTTPFSVTALKHWEDMAGVQDVKLAETVKQLSRLKHGRKREHVETEIISRIGA